MRHTVPLVTLCLALFASTGTSAIPYTDEGEDQRHAPIAVTDVFLSREAADRAARTDLKFAQDMIRHHQGAVDMARAYLGDARGTNPILVRLCQAIIRNQEFEIGVLDVVRQHVSQGPRPFMGAYALRRGDEGLEHRWSFIRAPAPGTPSFWLTTMQVSDFDVQFARPMIEHHSAALDMAMKYNTDPDGRSSVIGPFNYELMQDQGSEIDLLKQVLARYPGQMSSVPDDPRMMEIMHRSMGGMAHGMGPEHGH